MSCKKCQEVKTPCFQAECGCTYKVDTGCITYSGEDLTCSSIPSTTNLNEVLEGLDNYICDVKDMIGGMVITNVGSGAESFKGINVTGVREFRTLVSTEPNLTITEGTNTIDFDIAESSVSNRGLIEIATQAEVDTGSDNLRAVTPLTLNNKTATETRRGVIEIATQAEADAGVDNTRAITPLKMVTYVTDQINTIPSIPNATTSVRGIVELATNTETQVGTDTVRAVTPSGLNSRTSTEIRRGIIEIATQAEVNTGADDERAVTPLKLNTVVNDTVSTIVNSYENYVQNYVSNPNNLPNATTASRGVAELATSAEVIAGTDNQRIVTPSGLHSLTATTTRAGLAEIATVEEVEEGEDNTKYVTPATLHSTIGNISTGLKYEIIDIPNWESDSEYSMTLPANVGTVIYIVPQGVFKSSQYGYPSGSVVQLANGAGDQDGSSDRRAGVATGFDSLSTTMYYSTGRVEILRQDASGSVDVSDSQIALRMVVVYIDSTEEPELKVTPAYKSVPNTLGYFNITVFSNVAWTISESIPWLSLSQTSGVGTKTITATHQPNPEGSPGRSGIITISGSGVPDVQTTINQAQGLSELVVTPSSKSITAAGGTFEIEIEASTSWNIVDNVNWLSVSPNSGFGDAIVTVTVDEYTSEWTNREAIITVSALNSEDQTVNVTQIRYIPPIYEIQLRGPQSTEELACAGTGFSTYYIYGGPTLDTGHYLYTNSGGTNPAPDGWYTDGTFYKQVGLGTGQLGGPLGNCE